MWKSACIGDNCTAKGNGAESSQFFEWLVSSAPLDRSRHTLWNQKPPRDDVPTPSIHDDIDILIEEVTRNDANFHGSESYRGLQGVPGRRICFTNARLTLESDDFVVAEFGGRFHDLVCLIDPETQLAILNFRQDDLVGLENGFQWCPTPNSQEYSSKVRISGV